MGGAEGGNLRLISISSLSHLLRLCLRSRVRVGPPYMCYPAGATPYPYRHTLSLPRLALALSQITEAGILSPRSLGDAGTKSPVTTLSTTTNLDEIWSSPDLLQQYEQARYTPCNTAGRGGVGLGPGGIRG